MTRQTVWKYNSFRYSTGLVHVTYTDSVNWSTGAAEWGRSYVIPLSQHQQLLAVKLVRQFSEYRNITAVASIHKALFAAEYLLDIKFSNTKIKTLNLRTPVILQLNVILPSEPFNCNIVEWPLVKEQIKQIKRALK